MVAPATSRDAQTNCRQISPVPRIPQRSGNAVSDARVTPRETSLGVKVSAGGGATFLFICVALVDQHALLVKELDYTTLRSAEIVVARPSNFYVR